MGVNSPVLRCVSHGGQTNVSAARWKNEKRSSITCKVLKDNLSLLGRLIL